MKKIAILFLLFIFFCSLISVRGLPTTGTFTPINTNLTLSDPYPSNGTTGVSLNVTLDITCTSPLGYLMNLSWYENTTESWVLVQQNLSITNGTYQYVFSNASSYLTEYWWKVNLTDTAGGYNEKIYYFTTQTAITITDEYPSDASIDVCIPLNLGVTVADLNGKLMNITFWSNSSDDKTWTPFYLGGNCTFANVTNGTYYFAPNSFTKYNYVYYWNVSVNNGNYTVNSDVYSFTTAETPCEAEGETIVLPIGGNYNIMWGVLGLLGLLGLIGYFQIKRRRQRTKVNKGEK